MCGICGLITKNGISTKQAKFFQKMMEKLEGRGRDAFGLTTFPSNKVFKIKGNVTDYLKNTHNTRIWKMVSGQKIALGHTRATTTGSEDRNQNNHPFTTKKFIFAHNGIISNNEKLRKLHDFETSDIETDSYAIIKVIQKMYDEQKDKNVFEAIKETTRQLNGGYACWLLDKKTGEVYLFRERFPLSVSYIKDWDAIVFASETSNYEDLFDEEEYGFAEKLFGFFKKSPLLTEDIEQNMIYKVSEGDKNKLEFDIKSMKFETYEYWYIDELIKKYGKTDVLKAAEISHFSGFASRSCGSQYNSLDRENSYQPSCIEVPENYKPVISEPECKEIKEAVDFLIQYAINHDIDKRGKEIIIYIPPMYRDMLVKEGFTASPSSRGKISLGFHVVEKFLEVFKPLVEKEGDL